MMTKKTKERENKASTVEEAVPASSNRDTDGEEKAKVDEQDEKKTPTDIKDEPHDIASKEASRDKEATESDDMPPKEELNDKEAAELDGRSSKEAKDKDAAESKEESKDKDAAESDEKASREESKDNDAAESTQKSNAVNDAPIALGEKITEPCNYDVLLGRGKPFQNHGGNQHMLQLVDLHREEYNSTERASKNSIVERLIHVIKSSGGRFLERIDEGGNDAYWSEVPHATAYKKMSHALRSKHRTGHEYSGKKTKGHSTKAASKGTGGDVMGTPHNSMPPMMMQGYPMAGHPGFMGGPSSAMMMGNMMGMGPGGAGGMMANPMFQFEMQRAFFAQQEQMMHAQQRMWSEASNNGPSSATEATGNTMVMPSGGTPGATPGAAKVPEKTNTADV